jgi:succinoglycan biosynthesis protein ExoM
MTVCSICIAAYRRPEGLDALLSSLLALHVPPATQVEIVVVDNDPDGSALAVIRNRAVAPPFTLRLLAQPEKSISLTRNMAVTAATGDYLLFIDDDETAAPQWLAAHLDALRQLDADGSFGRIISIFPEGTPAWVRSLDVFTRPLPARGEDAIAIPTSNCCVRAALLKTEPGPFPLAYGTTGGEDSFLFKRLRRNGARLISVPEACVMERIPPARTRLGWILRRAYRGGNTFTRVMLELAGQRRRHVAFVAAARAACFLVVSSVLTPICLPSPRLAGHWATKVAANLGHLAALLGAYHHEYK